MFLKLSLLFFAVFILNVFLGAIGISTGVGDLGEALLLLATSIVFVIGILHAEKREMEKSSN